MDTQSDADTPELGTLHRNAIQLGFAGGLVTVVAYLIWALIAADAWRIANAVGPACLAIVSGVLLVRRTYRAEIVLILAALSTIVSYRFAPPDEPATPAAIGIVMIIAVTVLFMPRRSRWPYVWLGSLALLFTGVFWEGLTQQAIWLGVSASLSGIVAMVMFIRMSDAAAASDRRYRVLVERLPVPLIEEDWSTVRSWLEEKRSHGVEDIEDYLEAEPEEVVEALRLIKVRGVNPAIAKLTGDNEHGVETASLFGIPHEQFLPYVHDVLVATWHGVDPAPRDYSAVTADGNAIWARLESADLSDGAIPGVDRIIAATDVTALKETQTELAEQVQSKDEFIAAVSHELRTPLTSILGFAELLSDRCDGLEADSKEMMSLLLQQARDMSHIVEDLLVAARAEIGSVAIDPEEIDLRAVVEAAIAQSGGGFDLDLRATPRVHADPVRVTQILRNLATNARRYGGSARSVLVTQDDVYAYVEVQDDGSGVPADARDRIFEPYRRAHNRPGMTASVGLGLAVSRQLAELMGGAVTYRRHDGVSVFRLELPLASVRTQAEV